MDREVKPAILTWWIWRSIAGMAIGIRVRVAYKCFCLTRSSWYRDTPTHTGHHPERLGVGGGGTYSVAAGREPEDLNHEDKVMLGGILSL
jgi:hypothetical protein